MKYKHYAPQGEVTVFRGEHTVENIISRYDCSEDALILALEGDIPRFGARPLPLPRLGRGEHGGAAVPRPARS